MGELRNSREDEARAWYLAAMFLLLTSVADAVLDWNEHGVAAMAAVRQSAPDGARAMASSAFGEDWKGERNA
jgi:hypothetical protein